jgi:hypothetical protein
MGVRSADTAGTVVVLQRKEPSMFELNRHRKMSVVLE